ncbi:164_t:CDS:2 [Funneliformis geosporum]|uniref:ER membrane protein complex subunit 2 n=1 Tax=Funneliformis geosporum TaxID=1117311 RepID=A0A9W4SX59_9GLOM|nr:164_t:CDS:2 [Funneliformis geosporum]
MVSFDYKTAVTTLHELRKSGERKSDLVVFLGEKLINRGYTGKLGDEENLNKRFPGSPRVKILEGMKLEADDKLDAALALYEEILQEDEANIAASKRRIAVYKAKGQDGQAIDALTRHLDTVYNDAEAWLELSALYLNYHFENIPVALKQFCRVLELCEDNIRALCGIKLCTSRLLNLSNISSASTSNSLHDMKTISDLNALAVERLSAMYSKNQHGRKTAIEIKNVVIDWLSQS